MTELLELIRNLRREKLLERKQDSYRKNVQK